MHQRLYRQKTPYTSPLWVSYDVSFVRICVKIDCVIMALQCTWINSSSNSKLAVLAFICMTVRITIVKHSIWIYQSLVIHRCQWTGLLLVEEMACHLVGSGGRLKNTYELLNVRALKFSHVNKSTSFIVWVKCFMWNFKCTLWNSTQNNLPIHWKTSFLYKIEILRALRFESSYTFLKHPPGNDMSPVLYHDSTWNSTDQLSTVPFGIKSIEISINMQILYTQNCIWKKLSANVSHFVTVAVCHAIADSVDG